MTRQAHILGEPIASYVAAHTTPPDEIEARLIAETQQLSGAGMQIGYPQARFMAMLAGVLQPKLVIEIGTFTGYSTLVVAKALRGDGRLIACDRSKEWTSIASRYWQEAGVADRIDLRLGTAADTIAALPSGTVVDLAFIDADKTGYIGYFEQLVPLLAPNGVILVDNVLWEGRVVDESGPGDDTVALRAFNDHVVADPRVDVVMLPLGDGVSMVTLC